jgi:tetratricopeptide (TPR) repeat protein
VGFVFVTATLARPGVMSATAVRVGLFVAAATLLIHGQIEMTFFNLASVGPAWFVLGLCGAGGLSAATRDGGDMPRRLALLPGVGLLAVAVLFAASNASLITRQQAHVARAASALSVNNWQVALAELDQSATYIPVDDKPVRYRVGMRLEMATELRRKGMTGAAQERLDAALAIVDKAQARGLNPTTAHRYRAQIYQHAAEQLGIESAWPLAAAAMRMATERSPYNAHLHLDAADFAARAGQRDEARRLYRRTLELHELNRLDPAHQLSDEALQRVEASLSPLSSPARQRRDPD